MDKHARLGSNPARQVPAGLSGPDVLAMVCQDAIRATPDWWRRLWERLAGDLRAAYALAGMPYGAGDAALLLWWFDAGMPLPF
jgi:hypothetical protein